MLRSVPFFPKVHLIALIACATLMIITMVFIPSNDVAAERNNSQTESDTIQISLKANDQEPLDQATNTEQQRASEVITIKPAKNIPTEQPISSPIAATQEETTSIVSAPPPEEKWLTITVRSGDNLSTLFKKAGFGANEMYPMIHGIKPNKTLDRLMPGDELAFLIESGELHKLRHIKSPLVSTLITKNESTYSVEKVERTPDTREVYKQGVIEQSLFLAGQSAGLSQSKIMELAAIFGWDVDFVLDIRKGDSFRVIYEELLLDGEVIKDGNIVAAEFINQDKVFQAIRYTDSKGDSNYYTPEGDSMRKAFLRTPVDFTRISSGFNPNRKHPIFKTNRPHRGVDYAAATGTPIKSSGDGKVIFAGKKGGYGNVVIVQHGQKYTTLYAHMSRIKPGTKRGNRVSQGQTIGYVGSTGYATGPHLHYEFRVNGVHRNPLTVPLPQAQPLPKSEVAKFSPLSSNMLAQLETYKQTRIASAE